jgi:uncharacterized GH25 family protein
LRNILLRKCSLLERKIEVQNPQNLLSMKQKILPLLFGFISLTILSSHNLFIKLESFYLNPNTETLIYLYNGSFSKSETVLPRNEMADVSLINPGEKIVHPDKRLWYEVNNQTVIKIKTGTEGTGIFGVSTSPKIYEFTTLQSFADKINHEGYLHLVEARKKSGDEAMPIRYKYSKYVKALFQVGDKPSDDFKQALGYPTELIPTTNPYSLKAGDELSVKLLFDGNPVAGETVYTSYGDLNDNTPNDTPAAAFKLRTDSNGLVKVKLTNAGHWYFRTINIVKSTEQDTDYISISASITFEVSK